LATPAFADRASYAGSAWGRAEAGADERASRRFAALLAANPRSMLIAERALEHGMAAGDWPLALQAAKRLDAANKLPPLRRILLAAEALRTRDWKSLQRETDKIEREKTISLMVPMLRAWRAYGMRSGDPAAALAPMGAGPTSGYAVEHRALLELAGGRAATAPSFLALDPNSGLRAQHLRLAAAAEFAARGDKAKALALAPAIQPALASRRGPACRGGRPLPARIEPPPKASRRIPLTRRRSISGQPAVGARRDLARLASQISRRTKQAKSMIAAN
jgi:hypothetical protein